MTVVERPAVASAPEFTGFFEHLGGYIAGTTHAPVGATAGVVICGSLFTEALRNYRREVVLARCLGAKGIAAQRFHYRGTGNSSDGDPAKMTLATLVADARFARQVLVQRTGIGACAFLGTRFGALVAASMAREYPQAPLVLIEPVVEGRRFLKEGLRAKVMSGFKSISGATTVPALVSELERAGVVDILGDELSWSLYQSAQTTSLAAELGPEPRPILLVQLGSDEGLQPDYEKLVSSWRAGGCAVEVALVGERSAWWFLDERDPVGQGALRSQGLDDADELASVVLAWLDGALDGALDRVNR